MIVYSNTLSLQHGGSNHCRHKIDVTVTPRVEFCHYAVLMVKIAVLYISTIFIISAIKYGEKSRRC